MCTLPMERTLDSVGAGESCVILRTVDQSGALVPMGFIPGETLSVIRRRKNASVVRLRGMRVALGDEVMRNITVKPEETHDGSGE